MSEKDKNPDAVTELAQSIAQAVKEATQTKSGLWERGVNVWQGCAALCAVIGAIWAFIGAPVLDMRDKLNTLTLTVAKRDEVPSKVEFQQLRLQVEGHDQAITRFNQIHDQREQQWSDQHKTDETQSAAITLLQQQGAQIMSRQDQILQLLQQRH